MDGAIEFAEHAVDAILGEYEQNEDHQKQNEDKPLLKVEGRKSNICYP